MFEILCEQPVYQVYVCCEAIRLEWRNILKRLSSENASNILKFQHLDAIHTEKWPTGMTYSWDFQKQWRHLPRPNWEYVLPQWRTCHEHNQHQACNMNMAPKMLYKASYYGSSLCKVERRRSIGHIQLNSKLASVYNQQIHFLHLKNDVFIKRPCFTEAFPPFLSFGEKYFIKFRNDI